MEMYVIPCYDLTNCHHSRVKLLQVSINPVELEKQLLLRYWASSWFIVSHISRLRSGCVVRWDPKRRNELSSPEENGWRETRLMRMMLQQHFETQSSSDMSITKGFFAFDTASFWREHFTGWKRAAVCLNACNWPWGFKGSRISLTTLLLWRAISVQSSLCPYLSFFPCLMIRMKIVNCAED